MSALSNRFLSAVRLCIGPTAIKQRLTQAWSEHLDNIDPEQLPRELQADFIELRKAMYARNPLPAESAPEASIRKMSAKEASSHSELIVDMYSRLIRDNATINETKGQSEQSIRHTHGHYPASSGKHLN